MPPKFGPSNTLANRPIVQRRGHRDYIRLDNNKLAVVRVWNAATANWRLTPLGRKWAKQQQSEFVVSIPITMLIHRKDNTKQSFKGYLPATNIRMHKELTAALGMGRGMERNQAIAAIKREFKNQLEQYRDEDGNIVLFYESDSIAVYDDSPREDDREWRFSELQMQAGPEKTTIQNALLDQPLKAPHYSQLAHSDLFIPEAFHELDPGVNCACYQISHHLKRPLEDVTHEMETFYSLYYDGEFYVTPRMIFDYGDLNNLSVYYYYKNQLVSKKLGNKHARSICFTAHDGHCFLMKNAAFVQNREPRDVKATISRRLDVESVDKTPDISEWLPWQGELKEGRFYTTEDLGVIRQKFFGQNIIPKVNMTSKMEIKN